MWWGVWRESGCMASVKRVFPLVACVSILFAVVGVMVAQVGVGGRLDPLHATVSEYALVGSVTQVAMVVLAGGSLALVAGLRAAGAPVRGLPERLMLVWAGALVVAAMVPTTPLGHDLDLVAQIHRYVSVAAFVSLPAAGALLVPRLDADAVWKPVARVVEWVALAGGFGLLAITYVALPGDGVLIGLVERLLLGAEVALLAVLAAWLVKVTWKPNAAPTANFPTYHRFIASRS